MASGSVFGLKRTLPHIFGVVFGFAILLGAMILGLALVLEQMPALTLSVQLAGALWLAWLEAKSVYLAFAAAGEKSSDRPIANAAPLNAFEADLFQWANPKALVITASCAAAFGALSPSVYVRAGVIISIISLVGLVTSAIWTLAGSTLLRWLDTGWRAKAA